MIIDIHVHAFPALIRDHRDQFFSNEPEFKLLYESPKSRLLGCTAIMDTMDDQGVDRSVIFGFPWHDIKTAKQNNDYILDKVAKHPDRFYGFCCVDPFSGKAVDEVVRCLDAGLHGVGELAFYDGGIADACLDRLDPIMEICRQYQRPVMIHTNEPVGHVYPGKSPNTLAQIYALIRRFPENRIVLAHWGGGIFFYTQLKKEVDDALANVWVDTAASPYLYKPSIYPLAARLLGSDRILFGSDYPLLPPRRYFTEMTEAGLTDAERQAICGKNAQVLLTSS